MSTWECSICWEEFALPEKAFCTANGRHVFCVACVRKQYPGRLDQSGCDLGCLMTRACQGKLDIDQFGRRRKEREEVERQIYEAGLEGFWKCPFCDFGAICDSLEQQRWFTCGDEACRRQSCRLCQREAHPGEDCLPSWRPRRLVFRCRRCFGVRRGDGGRDAEACACPGLVCATCGQRWEHWSTNREWDRYEEAWATWLAEYESETGMELEGCMGTDHCPRCYRLFAFRL